MRWPGSVLGSLSRRFSCSGVQRSRREASLTALGAVPSHPLFGGAVGVARVGVADRSEAVTERSEKPTSQGSFGGRARVAVLRCRQARLSGRSLKRQESKTATLAGGAPSGVVSWATGHARSACASVRAWAASAATDGWPSGLCLFFLGFCAGNRGAVMALNNPWGSTAPVAFERQNGTHARAPSSRAADHD